MNVLLFGATGMVGQGVLRECLAAPDVALVQTVGRNATGVTSPKLRDVVHADLFDCRGIEAQLGGFDACFFCLGVSAAGTSEADYSRLTYDLTLAVATALARLNPGMTFVYVSGEGTDGTEKGRIMWARVKGRTENALRALPFTAVYLFRPGIIRPMHGARSKTLLYRIPYLLMTPVLPLMRRLAPHRVLTTEIVGRAMLAAARRGGPSTVAETADINALGTGA
ncbi:MAG: epimerase [Gemmatimonadetes bacterium 21-71-4]|nr:MAG: epimerase [Gemmatimonadetes bacterium 21-71-4]